MTLKCSVVLLSVLLKYFLISSVNSQSNEFKCGTLQQSSESVPGRNRWPWAVALIDSWENYFCGATLISQKHVLTAAHCLYVKNRSGKERLRRENEFQAHLGKYKLKERNEPGAEAVDIHKFYAHPEFVNSNRYITDADIAIIKFKNDVKFTESIQPACIWTASLELDNEEEGGTIVAWGRMENGKDAEVAKVVTFPKASEQMCAPYNKTSSKVSNRNFCAGSEGIGPCKGDSGSGFVTARDWKWFVRGITAGGFHIDRMGICDQTVPAKFTKLASFHEWITSTLKADDLNTLQCAFNEESCFAIDYAPTGENTRISQVTGLLVGDRTLQDVSRLQIRNQKANFLPIEVSEFFTQLTFYSIIKSDVRSISRRNFVDLSSLQFLYIDENPMMAAIPVDSFYDLVNLRALSLSGNQMQSISSETFINNKNLKQLYLKSNLLTTLDGSLLRNNLNLESFFVDQNYLVNVDPDVLTYLTKIETADFSGNTCINKSFDENTISSLKAILVTNCQPKPESKK